MKAALLLRSKEYTLPAAFKRSMLPSHASCFTFASTCPPELTSFRRLTLTITSSCCIRERRISRVSHAVKVTTHRFVCDRLSHLDLIGSAVDNFVVHIPVTTWFRGYLASQLRSMLRLGFIHQCFSIRPLYVTQSVKKVRVRAVDSTHERRRTPEFSQYLKLTADPFALTASDPTAAP